MATASMQACMYVCDRQAIPCQQNDVAILLCFAVDSVPDIIPPSQFHFRHEHAFRLSSNHCKGNSSSRYRGTLFFVITGVPAGEGWELTYSCKKNKLFRSSLLPDATICRQAARFSSNPTQPTQPLQNPSTKNKRAPIVSHPDPDQTPTDRLGVIRSIPVLSTSDHF